MHKIAVRAETEPRTRFAVLWGKLSVKVNRYIRGEPFDIFYEFRNDSDQPFPGGVCSIVIGCQVKHLLETQRCAIPPLKPGDIHKTESRTWGVLSDGHIGITCQGIKAKDGRKVEVYRWDGRPATPNVFIHGFFAETWESLYQYWALLISVVALSISAVSLVILAISFALGIITN